MFEPVRHLQVYKSMTAPEKDEEGNRIPIASSLSRRFRRDERPSPGRASAVRETSQSLCMPSAVAC